MNGPTLVAQGRQSGNASLDALYTHRFSKRLTATISFRGILQQADVRTRVRTGRAISLSDAYTSRRAVMIGIRYQAL